MGIFSSKKSEGIESPKLTQEKIVALESSIKAFIEAQKENIELIFNDNDLPEQKIEYIIEGNNELIKEENKNPLKVLKDYAIQWSIKGNNEINSTKCHLTFFNLGGLLGANGLLYSICEFYYFFSKTPKENRKQEDIIKDIEKCLKLIDKGNTQELNFIWKANITKEILNDLRMAKDFLLNLFHEKITNDIFENINNNNLTKVMKKCKSFKKGVSRFFVYIYYFLTFQLSNYRRAEEDKKEFLKQKNYINRYYLQKLLLDNINPEFFSKYNIFVLGSDDNTIPSKNLGIAFIGYHFKGLGEMHKARRLIENEEDGFIIGNDVNNNNKKLYNFYYEKIKDIKWFFEKNRDNICYINRNMNIYNHYINELAKAIDDTNEKKLHEGIIDVINTEENISFERTTQYTHDIIANDLRENNMFENYNIYNQRLYNEIREGMDENRAYEGLRTLRRLENNNYNNIINNNIYNQERIINKTNDNNIAPNYEEEKENFNGPYNSEEKEECLINGN